MTGKAQMASKTAPAVWLARIAVAVVFAWNIECIVQFLMHPESYAASFELSGAPGAAAIQGIAVAFLMWNATYPLVIWDPVRHRTLFGVVLAQQAIGLVGESCILFGLGSGHEVLRGSLARFIAFDACGLAIMALAFIALSLHLARRARRPL